MNTTKLKLAVLILTATLVNNSFADEALFDPKVDNPRIILAANNLANPGGTQKERKCTHEKVGNKICVLCEYTAINETTYNCYAIPKPSGSKKPQTVKKLKN